MFVVPLIFLVIIGFSSSLGFDPSLCGSDSDNVIANSDSEQCELHCENNEILPYYVAGQKSIQGYECKSYCPCKENELPCEWIDVDGCKVIDCIEKIDGCDNICPMDQCSDDEIYCIDWQDGCYKGYCEVYNWETNCQGGWHDVHNNDEQFFDNFETNCNGYSFGDAKICVPKKHEHKMQMAPKPPSNEISIVLSNIQITEIADKLGQMTILMDLELNWFDNRLKLIMEKVPTFLDNEDQKRIWSPRFRIGTDLVSHQKQMDDEFILQQYQNKTSVRKISYVSATIKCEMELHSFPFDHHECMIEFEDQKNETLIQGITLRSPKMSHVTNNYKITNITEYKSTHSNIPTFGIHISFERDIDRINGIVITYHLMCGILVLVATINFLIDPKDTDGRGGLLVTVFLVLTTFFTVAQGEAAGAGFNALTTYILICMAFICVAMLYYGIILFTLRKTSKEVSEGDIVFNGTVIKRRDTHLCDKIIKCDRIMIVMHVIVFILYNVVYYIGYYIPGARPKLYVNY